jgi:hypothetical protein
LFCPALLLPQITLAIRSSKRFCLPLHIKLAGVVVFSRHLE